MSLIVDQSIVSLANGTFFHAKDREFSVVRSGRLLGRFSIDCSIEWLKASQDGKMALIYGARGHSGLALARHLPASIRSWKLRIIETLSAAGSFFQVEQ